MKKVIALMLFSLFTLSCSSIKVASDYDSRVDFSKFRTFAFYKPEIDKATISDLDKKRILRAIEIELIDKGFEKSKNADMLISIFTKTKEKINVTNFGVGWSPFWGGINSNNVYTNQQTESILFIDIIKSHKKELIWQGIGSGILSIEDREKKIKKIKEFVKEILAEFPPKR